MFKFLFGVLVGAVGFWAYRFWKGGDDLSWDEPYPTSDQGATSYNGGSSDPISSGTASSPSAS